MQAVQTSHATATRIAVNRASALANRQLQIDVATLIQWVNARQENRPALAAFYQARFRAGVQARVRRLAGNEAVHEQGGAADAVRDEAVSPEGVDRKQAGSTWPRPTDSQAAKDANQRADNYMLAVVLFATALFFAGISTKLDIPSMRWTLLALGWTVFLGTAIWLATLPVQLTT